MSIKDQYFGIICSKTEKANKIKQYLLESLSSKELDSNFNYQENKPKAIIVIGGDGEMLHALHNFHQFLVPFIGINAGSIGFLMNEVFDLDLFKEINDKESVTLYPLEMQAVTKDGVQKTMLAFNEVSLYRATNQASKIEIKINNETRIDELIADGIIVSTPAGSSAYNFSAGGRIVPLDSKIVCVTPVCPFRPRRWHGAILPEDSLIDFSILEAEKRPVNAVADFNELKNVVTIRIKKQEAVCASLIFTSKNELAERIIKEQFMV